jgi:predicted nucleic acid-binding Zn ribbon protein
MRNARYRSPKPIGNAIGTVLERLGLGKKVKQYEVLDAWAEIVGEQIAKVASAERIRDGKLVVSVAQSTWRNELIFLKRELIAKINNAMHQDVVKDIIFR